MAYKRQNLDALNFFLPPNCYADVVKYIHRYNIQLTINKDRKRLLGTYTFDPKTATHAITVNGSLNAYNFLITLLHEIAHCMCFIAHRNKVAPHGTEWKNFYASLLKEFIDLHVFPAEIIVALQKQLKNPSASCSDVHLEKVLSKYDDQVHDGHYISDLTPGEIFVSADNKQFKMLEKRRTRYLCINTETNEKYLFPALYRVHKKIE